MNNLENIKSLLEEFPQGSKVFVEYKQKKNGEFRTIVKQNLRYNKWLKRVNDVFWEMKPDWPDFMCGGVRGRSYVDFARPHVGKKIVISIDLKNCFESISRYKTEETLVNSLNMPREIASSLAFYICYKGHIPQGFSTSSFVVNLYLLKGLGDLKAKLDSRGIDMSIYVDDMVVSSDSMIVPLVINDIIKDLSRLGFSIKKPKVKVMYSNKPQIICGLLVNDRISISNGKKKELLSRVSKGQITAESLNGWLSLLKFVDRKFMNKLKMYATTKDLIK